MARVSTYLNFPGNTEEAFYFYRSIFGGEFIGPVMRFCDVPPQPGQDRIPEEVASMILHIELETLGGHVIMATDSPAAMGFDLRRGSNMSINLEPDTREDTERLFNALAQNGQVEMPLADMFWGAYFGTLVDQYGIRWMFNCAQQK